MKKFPVKAVAASVLLALTISGCAGSQGVKQITKDVEQRDKELTEKKALLDEGKPLVRAAKSSVEHVNDLYLPVRKVKEAPASSKIPPELKRNLTINRTFTGVQDIAERITVLTGLPMQVSPEVLTGTPGMTSSASTGVTGNTSGIMPSTASSGALPTPSGAGSSSGVSLNQPINGVNPTNTNMVYSGNIAGFLDIVAARYSAYWEWNEGTIRLFRTKTKTYRLAAIPGDTTLTAKISNSTGGSSGGTGGSGSSAQETGAGFTSLSVWKSIEDGVKAIVTQTTGRVVVTPATGTVTVTDTPQVIAQVDKFIEQQNEAMTRQVIVNVKVYSVDISNSDNYGINWDAVYNSASGLFGLTVKSAFAPEAGVVSAGLSILQSAKGSGSAVEPWAGSSAVLSALSKQGRVTQLTSATVTTLNNQPAPVQVGNQTSYLASSTTSAAQIGVVPTVSLQSGVINTGFSMNLVPHLLGDDKLLLQYAIDLSSLIRIGQISSGTALIQTPEIETRNFLQRVSMRSGETLVVSGFEQTGLNSNTQGVGDAQNYAAGGGLKTSKNRSILVILLQPVITGS